MRMRPKAPHHTRHVEKDGQKKSELQFIFHPNQKTAWSQFA